MTTEEYLHRAAECERLAAQVNGEQRRKILEIAARWRELAEQSEPVRTTRAA